MATGVQRMGSGGGVLVGESFVVGEKGCKGGAGVFACAAEMRRPWYMPPACGTLVLRRFCLPSAP